MREVERHDAQRSSSSALAVREGVEEGKRRVSRENDRGMFVWVLFGGDDDDDDDDNNDHDETKKTRKTNGRKRFSSDRGRTMMRLFAEDFSVFLSGEFGEYDERCEKRAKPIFDYVRREKIRDSGRRVDCFDATVRYRLFESEKERE